MNFNKSKPLTFGMELEFQIVSSETGRLSPSGMAFWDVVKNSAEVDRYSLEATLATFEMNTSVHEDADSMLAETLKLTKTLCDIANPLGLLIRGGGTQLTQFWNERIMAPTKRAEELTQRFGYLPKRFSTYGMHVHVGAATADDTILMGNGLQALTPLFIAMSAASPFMQMIDTGFCAARPLEPLIYPHGGSMPTMKNWAEFETVADEIFSTELASSLKDIYWDVRPKPEYGTIEVRVFDTPLSIHKGVALAAFTRACAALILHGKLRLPEIDPHKKAHAVSRFLACRDGLDAKLYDAFSQKWLTAREMLKSIMVLIEASPLCAADMAHMRALNALLASEQDCKIMRDRWNSLENERVTTQIHDDMLLAKYSKELGKYLLKPL